jgi:hypothetical protein
MTPACGLHSTNTKATNYGVSQSMRHPISHLHDLLAGTQYDVGKVWARWILIGPRKASNRPRPARSAWCQRLAISCGPTKLILRVASVFRKAPSFVRTEGGVHQIPMHSCVKGPCQSVCRRLVRKRAKRGSTMHTGSHLGQLPLAPTAQNQTLSEHALDAAWKVIGRVLQ